MLQRWIHLYLLNPLASKILLYHGLYTLSQVYKDCFILWFHSMVSDVVTNGRGL